MYENSSYTTSSTTIQMLSERIELVQTIVLSQYQCQLLENCRS